MAPPEPAPDSVSAITDDIRVAAGNWDSTSGNMQKVAQTAADLYLNPTAFWVGSIDPGELHDRYRRLNLEFWTAVSGGATQTGLLANALRRIAETYDANDAIVAIDIEAAFQRPPQHGTAGPRAT